MGLFGKRSRWISGLFELPRDIMTNHVVTRIPTFSDIIFMNMDLWQPQARPRFFRAPHQCPGLSPVQFPEVIFVQQEVQCYSILSRELTYPTWGSSENHLQNAIFWGDMLVPRRVYLPTWMVDFYSKLVGNYTVGPMDPMGIYIIFIYIYINTQGLCKTIYICLF